MQHPRTIWSEGDAITKSNGGTVESNDLFAHLQVRHALANVLQDAAIAAIANSPDDALRLACLAAEMRGAPA